MQMSAPTVTLAGRCESIASVHDFEPIVSRPVAVAVAAAYAVTSPQTLRLTWAFAVTVPSATRPNPSRSRSMHRSAPTSTDAGRCDPIPRVNACEPTFRRPAADAVAAVYAVTSPHTFR